MTEVQPHILHMNLWDGGDLVSFTIDCPYDLEDTSRDCYIGGPFCWAKDVLGDGDDTEGEGDWAEYLGFADEGIIDPQFPMKIKIGYHDFADGIALHLEPYVEDGCLVCGNPPEGDHSHGH